LAGGRGAADLDPVLDAVHGLVVISFFQWPSLYHLVEVRPMLIVKGGAVQGVPLTNMK